MLTEQKHLLNTYTINHYMKPAVTAPADMLYLRSVLWRDGDIWEGDGRQHPRGRQAPADGLQLGEDCDCWV